MCDFTAEDVVAYADERLLGGGEHRHFVDLPDIDMLARICSWSPAYAADLPAQLLP